MKFKKRSPVFQICVIAGVALIGVATTLFSHASTGIPVGNPYIDPSQLTNVAGAKVSFYDQPWRGYMETVPATQFLDGIGVNYNPLGDTPAQDNANLQYLASIGIHAIRIELPWDAVNPNDETQLTASAATKYAGIFAACKQYGISPTILLNANAGQPQPNYKNYTATVVGSPQVGDSQITVSGVPASDIVVHQAGTDTGSSGIAYDGSGKDAGNLITGVTTNADGSLTLSLSRPLATVPGNAPDIISQGTTGSTSYSYEVEALNSAGTPIHVLPVGATSDGAATVTSKNDNLVDWTPISGAVSYNVYRTASGGTPSSTGLIGNITQSAAAFAGSDYFYDKGQAATDSSIPTPTAVTIPIQYLKYMPLYQVGTTEFNHTMAGWLQYVKDATGAVEAAGITNYSVEIWNELTFGSAFLSINNYYPSGSPLYANQPDALKSGGVDWQLADETTQYLKGAYGSNVKAIWGFSNTTFYHTASSALPPDTDGESYHPYATNQYSLKNATSGKPLEGSYIPDITVALPENLHALPLSPTPNLISAKLAPANREASLPPGTTDFLHYITETGEEPVSVTFSEVASQNELIKAKSFLRAYSFWLNKGLTQYDTYAAFDTQPNDWGWNMLAVGSDKSGSPVTPQSQALQNFTNQFAGATTLTSPRNLGVTVNDITPNDNTTAYDVFPADPTTGEPALNYREMFQFLPFQVTNNKFVISTYVMSWNIADPPPPMDFQVDITNVNGNTTNASYYDPISNQTEPVTVISRSANDIVLDIQSVDYPRLLTLDESGSSSTPTLSMSMPMDGSTVSGSTTISADASNETDVASVQFKLDGQNLGPVETSSPYDYSWDTAGVSNGAHTLTAVATDSSGNTISAHSVTVTVNNPTCAANSATPPASPTGLTHTAATYSSISLSWTASTSSAGCTLSGYHIYRNGSLVGTASGTTYTDTGLTSGTSYSYTVTAYDSGSNVSAHSAAMSASTTADNVAPNVPGSFAAAASGAGNVTLSWKASTDNPNPGGSGVKAYDIYRNGANSPTFTVNGAGTTSFSDTTVSAETHYTYVITAIDNAGNESAPSSIVSVTTPAPACSGIPSTPSGLHSTVETLTSISLSWTASTPSPGCTLSGYHIYRNGTYLADATSGTSFTDTGLSPGTQYSYTVAAFDTSSRTSTQTKAAAIATTADTTPPNAPAAATATATGSSEVVLNWSASTDNIGVTGYRIYRGGGLLATVGSTVHSYNDTTVAANASYVYQISAFDAANNESAQTAASPNPVHTPAATSAVPPASPTNLKAPVITARAVSLSWNASSGSGSVAGYHVYINGVLDTYDNQGATTADTATLDCLAPDVHYTVTIKAFDSSARLSPAASVNFTTLSGGLGGDVNCDATVNATDLFTLLRNWQQTDALPTGGDVNGDNTVNAVDLFDLLRNWGKSS